MSLSYQRADMPFLILSTSCALSPTGNAEGMWVGIDGRILSRYLSHMRGGLVGVEVSTYCHILLTAQLICRLGVLVEVNCETDFVAKGDIFKELVSDIAMQVIPHYIHTLDHTTQDFISSGYQALFSNQCMFSTHGIQCTALLRPW